ncbi:MAG: lyase family protein, partial [Candidatus Dormibacteria bacterium]
MSDFPGPDTTAELRQATSSSAWVQAMLDFEAALAAAEAEQGLIPSAAAQAISGAARAQDFDPEALAAIAAVSSNPTLALIEALRRRVGAEAAPWVHLGATSQDVLDSAAMLVTARALQLLRPDLERAASSCARLVRDHRSTLQLARTLLQPAVPTTLGLRAAGWLVALLEALDRLASLGRDRLALQLGGAGGTQAGLGPAAEAVSQALATRLGLGLPALPWHGDRARMAQLGFELGLAAGVCAKIATDVLLLSQAELGELREGGAESGSSAMP